MKYYRKYSLEITGWGITKPHLGVTYLNTKMWIFSYSLGCNSTLLSSLNENNRNY